MGYGLAFALGVFFTFLPNTDGSNKHRILGIIFALALSLLITVLCHFTRVASEWLFYLFFGVCIFWVSMLSVYGFRASMVAFSGHFAMIMSFALLKTDLSIGVKLGLIFCGGIWYLLWASLSHWIFENKSTAQKLAECVESTADFLKVKYQLLWNEPDNRLELEQKLLKLQIGLNEQHELLRELLFKKRMDEGESNKTSRHLLIFLEMLDIYELALARDTDPTEYKEALGVHFDKTQTFKSFAASTIVHLYALAEAIRTDKKLPLEERASENQELCEASIKSYVNIIGLPEAREGALILRNLLDYERRKEEKTFSAKRVYANILEGSDSLLRRKDRQLFITTQDYNIKTLKANLNLKSSVFKHALRLTIAMYVALFVGKVFEHQNAYWILLTVAVILRPNFGLTKKRGLSRVWGTLMGAAGAVAVILLFDSKTIYGCFAVPALFVGFVFLQKNYRVAATFITAAVILLYAILVENALNIVQYRVIDTFIGATISFLAIYLLWPVWEEGGIKSSIQKAIEASMSYMENIDRIYHSKETPDTVYRLARKKAFLESGNLMAAFQRQTEDPKSRQLHQAQVYATVVLNQTFLTGLAALGTYIQNHETTAASKEYETVIRHIFENLEAALKTLKGEEQSKEVDIDELSEATEVLDNKYSELSKERDMELEKGFVPMSQDMRNKLQEGKLMKDHLKWLHSISDSMKQTVPGLN
ncbi:FUSC family protein [Arcticibacterium luteifluviistationis]|uniref:FUSC family protein n=2 Tax=Arcticibacterium luteifluviistationis TaxID=1784714 RepID=A0A2Z4GFD0_9BACT|nr:FUSC family protein [Arcticibacterium luteifluviistationis]